MIEISPKSPLLKSIMLVIVTLLLVVLFPSSPSVAREGYDKDVAPPLEIKIDAGLITGTTGGPHGEIRIYKGIPFAVPPVGDLRWKPPQPVSPWTGVRPCIEFAPISPQSKTYVLTAGQKQSEDCLYLNVYTPAQRTSDRLPVFVSIHGGAMVVGSSRWPDMTHFAQNGVVCVSIAYRLGELGFMAHPLLSKESENGVSGNYGLMDQIAALKWVQRNIAAFGGDPDNVTIHGCSSGGESVLFLMASPFSKGVFHRAIADAGVYGSSRTPPLAQMEKLGEELAAKVGVSDKPDVLAALRAISADEIIAAGGKELPNVDGWFLPDLPLNVFQAGNQQNVPLMIGSGSADLAGYLNQHGDKNFASAMATVSSKAYAWVFDHAPCSSGGGTHCLDLTYLFYDLKLRQNMCDEDFKISKAIVALWIQFVKTGDPNVKGLIEWPEYKADSDQYLEIGDPFQVKTGLYEPGRPRANGKGETSSPPATYTNTEYGFSLDYPGHWKTKTTSLGPGVIWRVGGGTYFVPSVRVIIRDKDEGANLEEVFAVHLKNDGDKTIDSFKMGEVTINNTKCTRAEVTYKGSYGAYESLILGLVKNSKWIIIEVYTLPRAFPFSSQTQKAEILDTVKFN